MCRTHAPRDPFAWVSHTIAGKLRVESVVAEGGFAVVYRATHLGFDARARAEEALSRLAQGESFEPLALEYGDDATRSRGGDLGTFTRRKFPAAFTSAAFALEPGETSHSVVETRYGFHVIRRTQ